MRLDALLINQPAQHLARAISSVGDQRVGMQAECLLGAQELSRTDPTSAWRTGAVAFTSTMVA